jgi:hypothetical protein
MIAHNNVLGRLIYQRAVVGPVNGLKANRVNLRVPRYLNSKGPLMVGYFFRAISCETRSSSLNYICACRSAEW